MRNWIWHDDTFAPDTRWAGRGQAGPEPSTGYGQFATHQERVTGEHVLTRDRLGVNKLFYAPETYRGREYYGLPRLSPARLRRFLVDGLDSGDREVGIFAHFGFDTLQPYALCADVYTAIPGGYLESPQIKRDLVRRVMGDEIPLHVYERPKVRAQVASAAGVVETLATVVDRGFDSPRLAELLGATEADLVSLVRAGSYRFAATYPSDRPEVDGKAADREAG